MPNPLVPELTGTRLSVEAVMARPTIIRDRIAKLADSQILLPHLFRPHGARIEGGGLLYSVIKAADFYAADSVERREPGAEYAVLRSQDPESKLAVVDDFGGTVQILDEDVLRNDINRIDSATTQLTNIIVRALDVRAVAAVEAAGLQTITVATPWDEVISVGPATDLTPSDMLPTAAWAEAAELMELEELGHVADTLLVHPSQSRALKTVYAGDLPGVLESAGLKMVSNPRITEGVAYIVAAGAVGVVGFEVPLTAETVPERTTRSRHLMGYCVPAIAVTNPGAIIRINGLS